VAERREGIPVVAAQGQFASAGDEPSDLREMDRS
jgi:hypothetical protein